MTAIDEILLEQQGGLAIVTLNRPKALNTLSLAMYRVFEPGLVAWRRDPAVHAVMVRGAGDKAFCAGGDVRAIYDARHDSKGPGDYKADFFREEYCLIERVHRFPKPYIALVDGITMGGGCGVSINGSHRVATERTVFAMPEVFIGLFPDVGASRFLNLCPGHIGRYLALTGTRVRAADALYCGFATHYIPHERLGELTAALTAITWKDGDEGKAVDAVLARFAADPGPAPLRALRPAIDRCFGRDSVEAIVDALRRESGDWAKEALGAIGRASPLSLKITFRQLQIGVGMDIEAALALEYRMTQHCMAGHDFFEGIRALLVDKDQKPRWQHASLGDVGAEEVESYFAEIGARELRFAREESSG
ncbi:MAG TPA: enoyl-CoA hydratase/isomerase family protein [Stellaceae bacterium]|nr:enoyl-CoA hydratase/isomerase family protein [Stellaceae bacterium]